MDNNIKEIQNKSYEILKLLVKLFEQNDLTYYLAGGTFLGAVRHKGFIPWDDDIDISMPRKDYEKFVNHFKKNLPEYIFVQNFKTDSSYRYFITRVLDTRFDIEEIRTSNMTHPAVDILPLDGSPNNRIKRFFYFKKMMTIRFLISLSNRDIIDMERKRSFFENLVVRLVRKIPFEKILDEKKLKYLMERSMMKYGMEDSEWCGCLMGAYRTKEMVPMVLYGNGEKYKFRNDLLNGPACYDKYLSLLYGDYMKVPNQESIESKQHYKIIENKNIF